MKQTATLRKLPALIVIVFAAIIGYGQLLETDSTPYSIHSDIIAQHIGIKQIVHDSYQEKIAIPWWRNDIMSGLPCFTNPETQYFYPLHVLFFFLEPVKAFGITLWIHLLIGALIVYFLGHLLGIGEMGSLFMAIAQLFNFRLIASVYGGFHPVLPVLVLFPLLFATVIYTLENPNYKGVAAITVTGILCLSTGVFQIIYYALLFIAGLLTYWYAAYWKNRQYSEMLKVSKCLCISAILSAGVMSYYFLPLITESSLLSRSSSSYSFFLSGYSLSWKSFLTLFFPEINGTLFEAGKLDRYVWEEIGYFGLIPLFIAFWGIILGWRKKHTRFFVIAFFLSIFIAIDTPILEALYTILPGFHLFRIPNRFLYLTGFFGIVLSGIGMEVLLSKLRGKSPALMILPILLTGTVFAEGLYYSKKYITMKPANDVLPETQYEEFFAEDHDLYRISPLFRHTINSGWAETKNLQLVTGYTPFSLQHYQVFLNLLQWDVLKEPSAYAWADIFSIARWDLLNALNVKYIASPVPAERLFRLGFKETSQLKLVAHLKKQPMFFFFNQGMQSRDIYIYRNENFRHRASWANNLISASSVNEMIRLTKSTNVDDTTIVLAGDPSRNLEKRHIDLSSDENINILRSSPGHLAVDLDPPKKRFLVISEMWHPGWRAFLDGKKIDLYRTNISLMGTWIPPGKHRLTLAFKPIAWNVAKYTSLGFIAACIFLVMFFSIRKRDH